MSSKYQNPAKLFLKYNNVFELTDVLNYADFLRRESGLSASPPIDLNKIFDRFNLLSPKQAPFTMQQGAIVRINGEPQILLKEDDPLLRQRFTQAHELIEILFDELPGEIRCDRQKENIFGNYKESICQTAAAHLLMPQRSFRPKAIELGLSFQSAKILANEYNVSLTAALFRLVDQYEHSCAVILWKLKNKPKEIQRKIPKKQMTLPGFAAKAIAEPKLRVEWVYGNYLNVFIPKDKSIDEDSSVYQCWNTKQFSSGEEILSFGRFTRKAWVENSSIHNNGENFVLSLIRNL